MPVQAALPSQRERKVLLIAVALATLALAFLLWLIYVAEPAQGAPSWVAWLPLSDALCNAASAACALAGFAAVRAGRTDRHRGLMLTALSFSAAFLAGYILYHHFHAETHFAGPAWLRPYYFVFLASHVLLSALVLPMLLSVVGFAGLGFFERHKKLARWTLPLWLYVSVSGVAVFLILKVSGSY